MNPREGRAGGQFFTEKFLPHFLLYSGQHFKLPNCFAAGHSPEGWLVFSFCYSFWKGRSVSGRGRKRQEQPELGKSLQVTSQKDEVKSHPWQFYLLCGGVWRYVCIQKLQSSQEIHPCISRITQFPPQSSRTHHCVIPFLICTEVKMLAKTANS